MDSKFETAKNYMWVRASAHAGFIEFKFVKFVAFFYFLSSRSISMLARMNAPTPFRSFETTGSLM